MRKICIVTASRSEYGLLRWIMKDIQSSSALELQTVVTGAHLAIEHGETYKNILNDGFSIDKKVPMLLSSSDKSSIVKSMGLCQIGIADALAELSPDIIVVLGDRYELLPICSAALIMGIPIAHISGGDITEGAIDDSVRHAVSKMASLHFPGVEESGKRLCQMGEEQERIFVVGEPGLDNFFRTDCISKDELAHSLNIDINKKWILCTYHPETKSELSGDKNVVDAIVSLFKNHDDIELIITSANADFGGAEINQQFQEASDNFSHFHFFTSLGQDRYTSFMNYCSLVIGNSSSGVVEAATIQKAVIDIGDRQKGRPRSTNVIHCSSTSSDISNAYQKVKSEQFIAKLSNAKNPYGDGKTSRRVVEILSTIDLESLNRKRFVDFE